MKKVVKVVLCLLFVAMLSFGPRFAEGLNDGPRPDDRPIAYINSVPRNPKSFLKWFN